MRASKDDVKAPCGIVTAMCIASGLCQISPLDGERRAERRKPMVSVSVAGHGGRLSARHKQRLFDIGPRFLAPRRKDVTDYQPAPGRDSYWSRAEPGCRPSAHAACMNARPPHLIPLHRMPRETPRNGRGDARIMQSGSAGISLSPYSHSIVPGGFEVMSYTTRLMPRTSLMMRRAA
jgi:hypothetical protein